MQTLMRPDFETLSRNFHHWEKTADLIDQCIDLMLNLRQSGHPGGSRSKVPLMVASTLGAGMRWDIRHPERAFGDRYVLVAGHCCPVVYGMLAVYNQALRLRYEQTGDSRYLVPKGSLTVDGISLTVVDPTERTFDVAVIPETLVRTNLGSASVDQRVHLEADMIGKWVERLLAARGDV